MRPETENLLSGGVEPVLRALPDAELEAMFTALRHAAADLQERGLEDAWLTLLYGIGAPLFAERDRRSEILEALRLDVEANGHEVLVLYDEWLFDEAPRAGWSASCSCRWSADRRSEGAAREVGAEHLVEHGGAWGRLET